MADAILPLATLAGASAVAGAVYVLALKWTGARSGGFMRGPPRR